MTVSAAVPSLIPTGFAPLDALLGGGLSPGSVDLLTGPIGIGRSTLLAHVAVSSLPERVIYAACDELPANAIARAQRISPRDYKQFPIYPCEGISILARILARAPRGGMLLIDGAQELGSPVRSVIQVVADAARAVDGIAIVSFVRASPDNEREAHATLTLTRGTGAMGRELRCAKGMRQAANSAVFRLTRNGLLGRS
jgi:predicted ATP-dependent serine protease